VSSSMYHEYASEYDQAVRDNAYNAHFERPSLLAMLPDVNAKKVLDLGCGPGVYAQQLIDSGAVLTAIDGSEQMVQITRRKLPDKAICYVQDLSYGLPRENDHSFDLIISPLMIHYLEDLSILFADISRVLKPSGLFVFSTHHPYVDFSGSPSGNYFSCEKISEPWNTLGRPIEVSFYRRPMSEIFNALSTAGLCVLNLSEGQPSEALKSKSPKHYAKLSTQPNFMFYQCAKAPSSDHLKD